MEYVKFKTKFPKKFADSTLREAIKRELEYGKHKKNSYASRPKEFEQEYDMDSDEFYKKFEEGKLGDKEDFFEWYSLKEAYDHWEQTSQVLKNVSLD